MYSKDNVIVDRRELLRIKVNSLAAEARIIRQAERKARSPNLLRQGLREEMYFHRTKFLRDEARHTHLALGLIKGRTIEQMEPKRHPETAAPDMARINAMLAKYGPKKPKPSAPKAHGSAGGLVAEAGALTAA